MAFTTTIRYTETQETWGSFEGETVLESQRAAMDGLIAYLTDEGVENADELAWLELFDGIFILETK